MEKVSRFRINTQRSNVAAGLAYRLRPRWLDTCEWSASNKVLPLQSLTHALARPWAFTSARKWYSASRKYRLRTSASRSAYSAIDSSGRNPCGSSPNGSASRTSSRANLLTDIRPKPVLNASILICVPDLDLDSGSRRDVSTVSSMSSTRFAASNSSQSMRRPCSLSASARDRVVKSRPRAHSQRGQPAKALAAGGNSTQARVLPLGLRGLSEDQPSFNDVVDGHAIAIVRDGYGSSGFIGIQQLDSTLCCVGRHRRS